MKKAPAIPPVTRSLRQQAEVKLGAQPPPDRAPAEGEARALVHELQVHQIELELQNEELQRAQTEAQLAADKYAELFDFAPVGAFVLDPQGVIREVNLAGAVLLGRDRHLVAGQPFAQFLAPDARAAFRTLCRDVLADEGRRSCEIRLLKGGQGPWDVRVDVALARDASGAGEGCRLAVTDITEHKRNLELQRQLNTELEQRVAERTADLQQANDALRASRLAALNLTDDAIIARQQAEQARDALLREVTARKQAEEELRRVNRILRALSESDKALLRVKDEQEFLEAACRIVIEDCGYAMVWIGYAEYDAEKTVRPMAHAGFEQGYIETLNISWADTDRGRGPTGTAIRTGQPVACRNMVTDPAFAPWRGEALQRGYASSLVLPLREASQVFGAITLYSREPDPFTAAETAVLSDLANELATGILTLRVRAARQLAEAALRESEEKFFLMFEKAFFGVALAQWPACTLVDVNAAFVAAFGYSKQEVLGRTTQELGLEPSNALQAGVRTILERQGTVRDLELELSTKAGAARTFISNYSLLEFGGQKYVLAAYQDITARKLAEAALSASEEKARQRAEELVQLMDSAPLAILIAHDLECRAITGNQRAYAFFASEPGQDLDATFFKDGHELAPQDLPMQLAMAQNLDVRNCELEVHLPGRTLTALASASPLRDAGGRVRGCIAAFVDITERKQAEEAIQRAKEEWERTFNTVPDLIAILDKDRHILRANRAMAARLGTTPELCVGLRCHDCVHGSAHPPELCPHVQTLADGREHTAEIHEPRLGGDFLVTTTPLQGAAGQTLGVVHIARDITDRKRAEAQLRASEAQFRLLFEANPNPMWVFDEETLRFLAVNESALRHYGYARDEFLALTVLDLRLPEERPHVPEVIARQKGSKEVRVGVFRHLKKDATPMDVEIIVSSIPFNDRPGRLVLANDITQRLQAERTLHIQAAALDAAVNSILITDAQGHIQWVNPSFCKLTGYTLDEVRGQTPRMLKSGRQTTTFYALLWRTILAGQPWQGELINRHKNGQCYPEQMTITPFRAGMGDTITHFIAIKEDISVRKLAEDTIQRINTELESRVLERTASLYAANERMRQEYEQRRTTQTALEEQMRIVEAFLSHSLTPLVFLDRQCNYIRVNAAFARACGKHVADFPGHKHFDFFPHAENERRFAEVVRTGQPHQGVAQPLTFLDRPEGGVTYWDWTLVPLCDAAGAVEFLVYSLENVTERKRAADQVREFQDQLRALATSLLLTEERERKQLAMVLHDSIGQMLALMRIKIAALEQRLETTNAVADATALKKLAEDTIRQVRGLTTDLSPPILYQGGLAAALQDVGEHLRQEFGVDFLMDADSCPEQLDETLRVLLYQSGRELLMNVGKHAQADQVRLTIAPQGDTLRVVIEDDGVGFDPGAPSTQAKAKKSFGLFSIRERMFHVGGTMDIMSIPGQGTTVTLSVPVKMATTEERNG